MKKMEYYSVVIAMTFIITMFCVFMFWWIYPYKTITVNEQPYVVENKEIHIGETLVYYIDYCKYTNIVPIVHKQFIDGIIYAVPASNVTLPFGCHKTKISVDVPETLLSGEYKLKVMTSFQVNPIRTIINEYETERFSVIK